MTELEVLQKLKLQLISPCPKSTPQYLSKRITLKLCDGAVLEKERRAKAHQLMGARLEKLILE